MGFGLLAIEGKWQVKIVLVRKGNGRAGHQRNPFVSGAKQHIGVKARRRECGGITSAQTRQRCTRGKLSGIEKVGADSPRFQLEFTELQDLTLERQLDEIPTILLLVFCHT